MKPLRLRLGPVLVICMTVGLVGTLFLLLGVQPSMPGALYKNNEPVRTPLSSGLSYPVAPASAIVLALDIADDKFDNKFFRFMMSSEVLCSERRIMGRVNASWDVCLTAPFGIHRPCLVYSFGTNGNNWSFEKDVAEKLGCTVKHFDVWSKLAQNTDENVEVYQNIFENKVGLWSENTKDPANGTRYRTLSTIIKEQGDGNRVIDYLKIDTMKDEWVALPEMIRDGSLKNVKQLAIEVHAHGDNSPREELFKLYEILLKLPRTGFHRWYSRMNEEHTYQSKVTGDTRSSCYELYYLNFKYLQSYLS